MSTNAIQKKVSIRARIQAMGGFLTNMVLPNIGAFIAWGILTALFIPTGWLPNEYLGKLVGPTIINLLPLLLAYSGGYMIAKTRGAVMGTIGTMGLIIGSSIPMFLGAMIIGPLGGYIIKKVDNVVEKKTPSGFEMVINNFTIGIFGFLLMILSYVVIGPTIEEANQLITKGITALVATGGLPFLSIINEPAKVLFLNNVIDQGIYYPLGMQQTLEHGKSIFFMVASNPGPGLGLLLAYTFFGNTIARRTAPGAAIIHFFGGIHELYFPYVLMKPITIIGMILGAMAGIITFQVFDVGLVAGPSPGSIFAYLALTPKGNFIGVIAGVTIAAVVSFLVTVFILKVTKEPEADADDLHDYIEKSQKMKAEGKSLLKKQEINKISFACDAGMGSSAMGASVFRKKLAKNNIDGIEVKHYRIEDIPKDSDIIVIHKNLADRLKMTELDGSIIEISSYIDDPNIEEMLNNLIKNK
ncbi:PTS mannitol transporter subunit IICB [Orbus mooreae]|uniref:PTS mannitol transporter subunit IICB n=1 Tax=Orbus mooreae TaxID=3074107 RepID=UPI00370DC780